MSVKVSRQALARYATDQLLAGKAASTVAKNLAASLIDTKRQKEADLLLSDVNYELQRRGRLVSATVTTATKLSASLKSKVIGMVKRSSGASQVILTEQIDKKIVGGLRIETPGQTWDKTIATQLDKLRGRV